MFNFTPSLFQDPWKSVDVWAGGSPPRYCEGLGIKMEDKKVSKQLSQRGVFEYDLRSSGRPAGANY